MKETEEADVIAEQAFEKEQNLRLAAKVGLAFPSIKEKIIREFIRSLVAGLEGRLGKQWVVTDYWTEDPLQKDCGLALEKQSWLDKANIGLECEKIGPSFLYYFVWRQSKKKSLIATELKESLDKRFSHGSHYSPTSGGDTTWWKYVEEPYRDWNNETMLVTLWKKEEAVEYYVNRLVRICKIAGPFLDALLVK